MRYQEQREKRIQIFEDTLRFCERDRRLTEAITWTRKHTVFYPFRADFDKGKTDAVSCETMREEGVFGHTSDVCIITETDSVLQEVRNLHENYPGGRIGVVNLCAAGFPGGGTIRGENTSEGRLCRATTLYPCLNTIGLHQVYYDVNRKCHKLLDAEGCIYTPGIILVREDTEDAEYLEKSDRVSFDVISSAMIDQDDEREHRILAIARKYQIDILILQKNERVLE